MKSAAFFDVDNTLIDGLSQIIFVRYLMRKKEIPLKYSIRIALWYLAYRYKLTQNVSSVRNQTIGAVTGWTPEKMSRLAGGCFESKIKSRIFREGCDIIRLHVAQGISIVFVSSSLDVLVNNIRDYFGADLALCTRLEMRNGKYTGQIIEDVADGDKKASLVRQYSEQNDINLDESFAYSDNIADLPMLELVGHPKAVNPDESLADICRKRNWEILTFKKH